MSLIALNLSWILEIVVSNALNSKQTHNSNGKVFRIFLNLAI